MASLNRVQLIGNLGKDPELKYTPNSSTAVCTFSIATTMSYTDGAGNKQDKTEWHNIKAWQKLAETCAKYLTKGKQVYVEGRIETRSWEANGDKKYMTEIVIDRMLMLGKKDDDRELGESDNKPKQATKPASKPTPQATDDYPPDEMDTDEDLPF